MMRSLSLAFALSLLLFTVAEAKIATAPFAMVIQESEMGKAAKNLIESRVGKDQKQLEQEYTSLQTQDKEFQEKAQDFQKQAATMSEKVRTQRAQELDKQLQTLRQKALDLEERRKSLAQKAGPIQQKVNAEIMKVLQTATENIAKEKGLELILDATPPVYYVANSLNIKGELLSEVNKIWKKNGSKFKI